jgi:hypothetical protein
MRAHVTMKITDTHGDVPYSEAAGALDGVVFPAYDDQEVIYTGPQGVLEELANASAALSASAPMPQNTLHDGDLEKWRRFGNSLLLRRHADPGQRDRRLCRGSPARPGQHPGVDQQRVLGRVVHVAARELVELPA